MLEIRMKEDIRMMSPDRDLKHCVVPMLKAATELTNAARPDKESELSEIVSVLCAGVNAAKLAGNGDVPTTLDCIFTRLKDLDEDLLNVLSFMFLQQVIMHYIRGVRETTDVKTLEQSDILNISVVGGVWEGLPKKFREAFTERMRDRRMWTPLDSKGVGVYEDPE